MAFTSKSILVLAMTAVGMVLFAGTDSRAQVQRYEPGTPTVSPYLNLFQNNRNGRRFNNALPNYYSLVRPQLRQQQTNKLQQHIIQQQGATIGELQSNLQLLEKQQQAGPVLTGHGSWFDNPGARTKFLDTSRYYSRAGTAGRTAR